jgi:hypothetical protein
MPKPEPKGRRGMMTINGLLIERVVLGEGSIQETEVVAREIVRTERGSVYELTVKGMIRGYLKLIISGESDMGETVKSYAQADRNAGRVFLGTNLDFDDAVDSALGIM